MAAVFSEEPEREREIIFLLNLLSKSSVCVKAPGRPERLACGLSTGHYIFQAAAIKPTSFLFFRSLPFISLFFIGRSSFIATRGLSCRTTRTSYRRADLLNVSCNLRQ